MTFAARSLFCFLLSLPAYGGVEESIVGLYVTLEAGRSDLGTGFFSSADGQIVTAYHVVNGARKIKAVTSSGQIYDDLRIDYVSPQRDLAVLQIISKPQTPGFLKLTRHIPDPKEELSVIGYPRGLPTQVIRAHSTSYKLLSSFTLRDARGQRLFKQDIEILPLDATVYSGMSGAPVLSHGEVHGILSGSFDEGGTIAWMIPTQHLDTLVKFQKRPEDVSAWPSFDLMAAGFRSLSRSFRVDSEGEKLLEAYLDAVERYAEAGTEIGTTAMTLHAQAIVTRPFFQAFLEDPALSKDQNTARVYLEPVVGKFLSAVGSYGEAHTAFAKASGALGNSMFDLLHWAEGLAAAEPKARAYLIAADQRVQNSGTSGAYYEAIGYNPQRLAQLAAHFGATVAKMGEGFSANSARQYVSGLLELGYEYEADSAIHASGRAVSQMRKTIATLRGVAKAFEPLVYLQ
jgi:hypothetical protein